MIPELQADIASYMVFDPLPDDRLYAVLCWLVNDAYLHEGQSSESYQRYQSELNDLEKRYQP